jgi:acetylornithine deacetylase
MHDVVSLACELVAIDSVNPSLVSGGAGEEAAAAFVLGWAERCGLEAERLESTPGRPSVVVRARGRGDRPTLLLCGHLDTVGYEGMQDPLVPRLDGDRLYGRGAYDMKAGLAAALIACRDAAAEGLAGDVVVAAVADEEHASLGVQEAMRSLGADAAIVTEPTELEVARAHKGFAWLEVEVEGQAAHGSRPHLGVDAIVKAGPLLVALGELDASLAATQHELLGRGSLHASLIEGGRELSTYPDRCLIQLERRTLPGTTPADVERELAQLVDRCRAADPQLVAASRLTLSREPLETPAGAAIVELVQRHAGDVLGAPPSVTGASFWADSAFIAAAGVPTVLFGPSGAGAHAREEWVSVPATLACHEVLVRTARELCG